jgi:uncharacterized protein HemX
MSSNARNVKPKVSENKKWGTIVAVTAIMAALALAAAPSFLQSASAKITEEDTSCENRGGHEPGGQQPSCEGEGLTQNTENQNPAGHAPPGQNDDDDD